MYFPGSLEGEFKVVYIAILPIPIMIIDFHSGSKIIEIPEYMIGDIIDNLEFVLNKINFMRVSTYISKNILSSINIHKPINFVKQLSLIYEIEKG